MADSTELRLSTPSAKIEGEFKRPLGFQDLDRLISWRYISLVSWIVRANWPCFLGWKIVQASCSETNRSVLSLSLPRNIGSSRLLTCNENRTNRYRRDIDIIHNYRTYSTINTYTSWDFMAADNQAGPEIRNPDHRRRIRWQSRGHRRGWRWLAPDRCWWGVRASERETCRWVSLIPLFFRYGYTLTRGHFIGQVGGRYRKYHLSQTSLQTKLT